MDRKLTVTGANKVFFAFVVSYLIFQIGLSVAGAIFGLTVDSSFIYDNVYGILLINQYVIILVPVLVYVFINRLNFRETFRIHRLPILPALLIVLMAVPAQYVGGALNTLLIYLLQFIGDISTTPVPVSQTPTELITGILIIGVSPAICEEMLHRGMLLSAYERRGSMRAVFITAAIFGLFHFDITNLLATTFLGMLFAYYVIRTNSIFAGMLAHFLNNTLVVVIQYLTQDIVEHEESITVSSTQLISSLMIGVVSAITLAGLLMLFRHLTVKTARVKPPISTVKKDVVSTITHWPILTFLILYFFLALVQIASFILSRMNSLAG